MKMLFCFLLAFLTACSGSTLTLTPQTLTTATSRVSAGTDDAEQRVSNGAVQTTSSDLEMTYERYQGQQIVGMRFPDVQVPQGAVISSVRLEVNAAASTSGTVSLRVYGQNADDAAPFAATSNNISGRSKTAVYQSWTPGSWSTRATAYTYGISGANLTSIVQGIVNRPGWQQGNALALIIPNTGTTAFRNAVSFDGNSSKAPRLVITYEGATIPIPPTPPARELIFSDEFSGTALDTNVWAWCYPWGNEGGYAESGGNCYNKGTGEKQLYLPGNVGVSDGLLKLTARRENVTRNGVAFSYTSGMVASHGRLNDGFLTTGGLIEARIKMPKGQGLWPAFWLLPMPVASRPEIDITEVLGHTPTLHRMHYHYLDGTGAKKSVGQNYTGPDLSADFHTYAVDWTPGKSLVWLFDGKEVFRFDSQYVPNQQEYILLNLAVDGWAGPPDSSTTFPAVMEVDWIRVYR